MVGSDFGGPGSLSFVLVLFGLIMAGGVIANIIVKRRR